MRTTPVPDLAGRLRLVIARTARRLRQEAGTDLSPSLTSALATIDRHGPLTPSELAARERVQRPTATRMLARLEETALVVRTPDPQDRVPRPAARGADGARARRAGRGRRHPGSGAGSRPTGCRASTSGRGAGCP